MVKFFFDCLADRDASEFDSFVVSHPDPNMKNFIVSEEGELLGIVGWEGVSAWPVSFGNRRYPVWLAQDWLSGYIDHRSRSGFAEGIEYWLDSSLSLPGARLMEYAPHSPEKVAEYRAMYSDMMTSIPFLGTRRFDVLRATTSTVIITSIFLTSDDPWLILDAAKKVYSEIQRTCPQLLVLDVDDMMEMMTCRMDGHSVSLVA